MENYIIPQTKYTPLIELHYQDKFLRIYGDSYPENAMEIFQPLINKLDEYFKQPQQSLVVDLRIDYLNTSSTKMMTDMLSKLQSFHDAGHSIKLSWSYPEGDIDCQESCEMYLEDATFPYSITPVQD